MPPLHPRLPTFCSFLYPPRLTQPRALLPLLNIQPSQPSNNVTRIMQPQRRAKSTRIENDVGLLPGTFVMPSGPRKPSIFRTPNLRLRLEWFRLKNKLIALRGCIMYKYFLRIRPRPKLRRKTIVPDAKSLYEKMYTSFAEGDLTTLTSVCHEGLFASLRARINVRPPKERLEWTLHKYIGSARIVSTNIVPLETEKSALYQVVVRIRSMQGLERSPANRLASDTTKEKKVVEYVVLQRKMLGGKEEGWKIWGTTEESKVEDVLGNDPSDAVFATSAIGKK